MKAELKRLRLGRALDLAMHSGDAEALQEVVKVGRQQFEKVQAAQAKREKKAAKRREQNRT